MPCWVDKQEHGLQEIGDLPFALLGIAEASAGVLCPSSRAQSYRMSPRAQTTRPVLQPELVASEEEGLDELPATRGSILPVHHKHNEK